MNIAVCILARNEERSIASILSQLAEQSLVADRAHDVTVHVVCNGCTDGTAAAANACADLFAGTRTTLEVHTLGQPGKSRSWNTTVHGLVPRSADFIVFLDADIELLDTSVMGDLLADLQRHPDAEVWSGYPLKDISAKSRKSSLDRFSLAVSRKSRHSDAINGSLYVARASALADVWLPNETPGEDGFLNAMVTTRGFTTPPAPGRVVGATRPTHYFRAHRPYEFHQHERRMIVGTMVNIWIFERLWSLQLKSPAGPIIRDWNEEDPDWVERLIRSNSDHRFWLVRPSIVFGRFRADASRSWWKRIAHLPIALGAIVLTLPPAIAANARLKQLGSASTW